MSAPRAPIVWHRDGVVLDVQPEIVVFDMDDTLSLTKSPISDKMATLLDALLGVTPVCVISGSRFEQMDAQILSRLQVEDSRLSNLHLMPTCGTRYCRYIDGGWVEIYAEKLSESDRLAAKAVLTAAAKELGFWEPQIWGERIEDRASQVTFSALGQFGPPALKAAWDPLGEKKLKMREYVASRLPDLEVRSGGTTSIDITKKGIDKAYGVRKLISETGITAERVLFVGDSFAEHGNDYPVVGVGVASIAVSNHIETEDLISYLLDTVFDGRSIRGIRLSPGDARQI